MSFFKVCSGTRPSRYHSVRAISMPFNLPELIIFTPSTPRRIADAIARRIARRNIMRRSNCEAMFAAINAASASGFCTSRMSTDTSLTPKILRNSTRNFSMPSPFLPMTAPGRPECTITRTAAPVRSISTKLTEAPAYFFSMNLRACESIFTILAKSAPLAYQRDFQSRRTDRRKPTGLTFLPITRPPFRLCSRWFPRLRFRRRATPKCGCAVF